MFNPVTRWWRQENFSTSSDATKRHCAETVDSASATMVSRDAMRNDIACHQKAAGLSAIVPCHS